MEHNSNFRTFLFISLKKLTIISSYKSNFKIIYKKEIFIENESNSLAYGKINEFIKTNIFLLEKKIK